MGRHGVRLAWSDVPAHVREAVDVIAASPVTTAVNIEGGFSPGPAARCRLSDGRTVFVKAAGLDLNARTPGMHRTEAEVLSKMSDAVPAPELVGVFDDGDWVALVIEWVSGRMPTAPLDRADVDRLLRLVERLAHLEGADDLAPCFDVHSTLFGHWQQLIDEPVDGLDAWSHRHLEALAELEVGVADSIGGDRLVHLDLRTDNILFADHGEQHDVIVDWPGASVGAPWVDLVGLLPSLEMDGGPRPEDVFDQHPVGAAGDPQAVDAFLSSVAGYFTRMSLLPPPPGLPTVRAFQAEQGTIARRWLANRQGWSFDPAT